MTPDAKTSDAKTSGAKTSGAKAADLKAADARIETAPFKDVILICSKCAAKLGRGHKGKTQLRGELKGALKRLGLAKTIRVADTTCLDHCPKKGQTIVLGRELAAGRLRVVGADADGEDVAKFLFQTS
jgi:predicted metal-binding protein